MEILEIIKKELRQEADSIQSLVAKVGKEYEDAVNLLYNCSGKVVVSGMGKTGIIGRKLAATLASTGTTAIFLHPAEGIHGDLGMVQKGDVFIALSYSGNTREIVEIIPYLHFHKIAIIAITGNIHSELAAEASLVLDTSVKKDYEPFGLVPTCSTTAALAAGDALAVALLRKRKFCERDFAQLHPGGTIGKRLLLKVADLMHKDEEIPQVSAFASLDLVVLEMTGKKLGCTCVTKNHKLLGIITDGDLRRLLSGGVKALKKKASEIMTPAPQSVDEDMLAVDALNIMEDNKITMLPVVDSEKYVQGVLHMHDLIQAGVVG